MEGKGEREEGRKEGGRKERKKGVKEERKEGGREDRREGGKEEGRWEGKENGGDCQGLGMGSHGELLFNGYRVSD